KQAALLQNFGGNLRSKLPKDRFFKLPPLDEGDIAALGLKMPDPRSDYGYAIYMGIMPPGGATLEQAASKKRYLREPPKDGEGLRHYRFTRRRKEKIIFDAEDAGMTVYICCRYENAKGEAGKQWGSVVSGIIP
ncbi:MAG: hypothetical protein LBQ14_11310, partial [Treponema sp.]|nr:hypothetical protein [Treponema sp.]